MDYSHGVLKAMNSPFFPDMRMNLGPYFVDKTEVIKGIVDNKWTGDVHLVLRPRRCGKSTMLQMLKSFFSIPRNNDPEPQLLFGDLHIASRQDICTEHMGKYAVIFCDFKNLFGPSWDDMLEDFKGLAAGLYMKWEEYLRPSLDPWERTYFESICGMTATEADFAKSLYKLSQFLARKVGRKVIVLIDEYEVPNDCAYEHGYFEEANTFFGCGVLARLLKSNENLQWAVLAGITPAAKSGWYSSLTNLRIHALHTHRSIFAGKLMFTEAEVDHLRILSESELRLEDLRAYYSSYNAAGHISVYNPVSVMSALKISSIEGFWVATDSLGLAEDLLAGNEIDFELTKSVTCSSLILSQNETLTLLYYAGYLTVTANDRFKIPNPEVMTDWAGWIVGDVKSRRGILKMCLEGPVSDFESKWPNFMQELLHPKLVAEDPNASSHKIPERFYLVFLLGLFRSVGVGGWKVSANARAGGGYVDLRLIHKWGCEAVLIGLRFSEKEQDMKSDANSALQQIADKSYRIREGLPNIRTLREYGIAAYHLSSYVKGRYLELNTQNQWVEKDDPAKSVS